MPYDQINRRLYVNRSDSDNPIGITDREIRACLTENAGVDLSRSSRINPWAKFKPLPVGDMLGYTDAQAKAINYGLFIPRYTSFNSMVLDIQAGTWTRAANYDSTKTPWQNLGLGANDWSRFLDFDGYFGLAEQIMATLTMDSDQYAAGDIPSFITRATNGITGNLGPSDIRLVENGSVLMENLYYGIYFHHSEGGYYKVLGRCSSLGHAQLSISDVNFVFPRNEGTEPIVACMFLCDSNLNNGNVGTSTGLTGNFIPITPTRANLSAFFAAPHANFSYDPVTAWMPTGNGDVVFVVKSLPDSNFTWACNLSGEYQSGGTVHPVLQTVDFNLFLAQYFDNLTEQQKPLYIRMQTDRLNRELEVKVYAPSLSADFPDVFSENNIGNPVATAVAEIALGEILNSSYAVSLMSMAVFAGAVGSISEQCLITP